MTENEKVVKGLEHCYKRDKACIYCPYHGECCTSRLARDALALLRKQEEQIKQFELEKSWDENPDRMGKW